MKTRRIFLFAFVICLAAKAQITELPIIIKGKEVVYADKKLIYAFDSEAFYRYEDTATQRFWPVPYKCDTVKWGNEYSTPALKAGFESSRFCKFADNLNGIIIRKKVDEKKKCVTLKTTDGGKQWTLLHELPDSVGYDSEVSFRNFDNYVINTYSSVCLFHKGQFTKPILDENNGGYSVCYGDDVFAVTSVYNKTTHLSSNGGDSWDTYAIPSDTGIWGYKSLQKAQIVNKKLYLLHRPSPYAPPEVSQNMSLTTIDLDVKQLTQKKVSESFHSFLVNRKGEVYLTNKEKIGSVYTYPYYTDFTLHLLTKDTNIITSRLKRIDYEVEYHSGAYWNLIEVNDSSLYFFDHPDCENIDHKDAKVENNWMNVEVGVKADIEPVHYPYLIALDAKTGDTTSIMCCRYLLDRYYMDGRKDPYDGKIIKNAFSDSVLILLSQLHRSSSMCVTSTTYKSIEAPLSFAAQELNETAIHLFPNPSSDFVQFSNVNQAFDLKVVNDMGQVVLQRTAVSAQEKIDIRHLDKGHYSILITFENDSSRRLSFIKP